MNTTLLRHVPWTCQWGRFGVAVEQVSPLESQVDDVFWVCHHPMMSPHLKMLDTGECRTCPVWKLAGRLSDSPADT